MAIRVRRRAEARWNGTVPSGFGHIRKGSGALDSDYSLRSRETDGAPLTDEDIAHIADQANRTCPVPVALTGTTITLAATKVTH